MGGPSGPSGPYGPSAPHGVHGPSSPPGPYGPSAPSAPAHGHSHGSSYGAPSKSYGGFGGFDKFSGFGGQFGSKRAKFDHKALVAILCYVPFLNSVLGTRMIAFPHFAVPSVSFFMIIIFYDETRKVFLRNGMEFSRSTGKSVLKGWTVQNTYY